MDNKTRLAEEWQMLQNNHEQHEKSALLIKLTSLILCVLGMAAAVPAVWLGITVTLCWLQEAIYKTFQARLVERLLRVEQLLCEADPTEQAMQLYSAWTANRPSGLGLIAGYAASALKPTVAFPYLPILLLGSLVRLLHWA